MFQLFPWQSAARCFEPKKERKPKKKKRTSFPVSLQECSVVTQAGIISGILHCLGSGQNHWHVSCHCELQVWGLHIGWNGQKAVRGFSRWILLPYRFSTYPVFKSPLALSPSFLHLIPRPPSKPPLFCYFTWRSRCEGARPHEKTFDSERSLSWRNPSADPEHLGTQWQMDLQFSARLGGHKGNISTGSQPQSTVSQPSWTYWPAIEPSSQGIKRPPRWSPFVKSTAKLNVSRNANSFIWTEKKLLKLSCDNPVLSDSYLPPVDVTRVQEWQRRKLRRDEGPVAVTIRGNTGELPFNDSPSPPFTAKSFWFAFTFHILWSRTWEGLL